MRDAEGRFGSGKNTRRFRRMPGLLRLGSRYPEAGTLTEPELLDVLKTVARAHAMRLDALGTVTAPGTVGVGDVVAVIRP
ncbi:Fe-S protein [Streptomyces sp. NPDC002566]|uniref:Fe-S protein n=1 Tax=Streptomyces sp. NPDC002566 TaxID=3364650 RepID=UPI00369575EE